MRSRLGQSTDGQRVNGQVQHRDAAEPRVIGRAEQHRGSPVGEHGAFPSRGDEHDDRAGAATAGSAHLHAGDGEIRDQARSEIVLADLADEASGSAVRGGERRDVRRAPPRRRNTVTSTSVPTPGGPESHTTMSSTRSPTAQSTPGPYDGAR